MEYYQKSLAIKTELGDVRGQATTLMNLGSVYVHQGEYEKAMANFQTGLIKYEEIGVSLGWPKKLMGDLYLDMGDAEKAEPLLTEAGHNSSLGRLHLLKSDYRGAKQYYEKLLELAEKSRNVDSLFTAYTGLGIALEGIGDDKKAEEYYLKAVNLTEELRSSLPKAQRETFFDVRINGFLRTAPYDGLARVRVRMNRPLEAFKDSSTPNLGYLPKPCQMVRVHQLRHSGGGRLRRTGNSTISLSPQEKGQEAYEKSNQEVISVIEPQVKEKERELKSTLRFSARNILFSPQPNIPNQWTLDETALKPNEWVLAYHVTDPGIIIYLTKGKEIVKALFKPIRQGRAGQSYSQVQETTGNSSGRDDFDEKLKSFDLLLEKSSLICFFRIFLKTCQNRSRSSSCRTIPWVCSLSRCLC